MNVNSTTVAYQQTGYFSKLIVDYLNNANDLQPFYQHKVSAEGIRAAIAAREKKETPRALLVQELEKQYAGVQAEEAVQRNIQLLGKSNTFTFCTAHQPAIFTGNLYFIYKILHVIKLAERFKQEMPEYNFVPVFWMGSEDADLDELGSIYLSGEKLTWNTQQKGAVGRMNTKGLEQIIHRIEGELSVQPYGKELVALLKECYLGNTDIQTATFRLLHALFSRYGLVVIIPDNANLKRVMQPVFEDDLFKHQPAVIVNKSITQLSEHHKVQANPRDVNLFYLKDDVRDLIELRNDQYEVRNTNLSFTKEEIRAELEAHPERFSPNVILRGLYQETILPNIAFVGGGGETAYWLELKGLFEHYATPFPVLILRNSFLVIEKKWQEKVEKMGWSVTDVFLSEQQLLNQLVSSHKNGELKLQHELDATARLYQLVKDKALAVDKSLLQHVEALQVKALKPLQELEKKLLRAEKKKYESEQRQIHTIKTALFPRNGLQERIDNFMPYYAQWGTAFIDLIYQYSLTLEQEFVILAEQE
ncbi:MAG: bacillithiol biosynthesis cysteine-adding enzyme BshC [Chitinophagaceae bacterium]